MSYISILTDDRNAISYRPKLRELTGSVTATILFQQILYWWEKMGRRPFYKFIGPCQHEKYKKGDSWSEELGFSRQEFTTAIKKIGKKITKGTSKKEVFGNHMIIYWTDASRVTWFQVNEKLVETKLRYLYNSRNSNYLETEEPTVIQETQESRVTFPTETTPETTPETTISADAQNAKDDKKKKEPTPAQLNFSALVKICGYDIGLLTKKDRGKFNFTEKKLREEAGAIHDEIADFGVYWFSQDWRGKQGQHPEPEQIRSQWGRYKNWRNGGGNAPDPQLSAAGTYGPVACAAGLGDTITAADFTEEELG